MVPLQDGRITAQPSTPRYRMIFRRGSSMKRVAICLAAGVAAIWLGASVSGLDLTRIDRTVAPGPNFFAFATGARGKAAAIPEDRSVYGVAAIVQDSTR